MSAWQPNGAWFGTRLRLLILSLFVAGGVSHAVDLSSLPKPTGYVSDLAHVLSEADKQNLEALCTKVDQQLGAQVAIVTIDTLNGQPIEDFSIDLARKWGIGPKGKNEGILILIVVQDHKDRVEVGYGLEQYITDAISGDAARAMRPALRQGNYGAAFDQAVRTLAAYIAQGKNISFSDAAPIQRPPSSDSGGGIPVGLIIFGVIFLLFLILSRRGGGPRGSGGGGSGAFWTGVVLNSMLNSGGRGGGGWGGGGGFGGGGDGGGGGGFGGFGGGDFGGGGASSDW